MSITDWYMCLKLDNFDCYVFSDHIEIEKSAALYYLIYWLSKTSILKFSTKKIKNFYEEYKFLQSLFYVTWYECLLHNLKTSI